MTARLLLLLSWLILSRVVRPKNTSSIPSAEHLQHEIDAIIEVVCSLGNDEQHHEILNDFALNGGLYTLGMYYRFNQDTLDQSNGSSVALDLVNCIQSAIQCLESQSISISAEFDNGQLIAGDTGTTSLAVLGMIELCITSQDTHALCQTNLNALLSWIEGLIMMRRSKLKSDNYTLSKGAFSASVELRDVSNSVYDAQAYVAIARLIKYETLLYGRMPDAMWQEWNNMLVGLDTYYLEFDDDFQNDTRWLIQAWFDRWVTLSESATDNNQVNRFMDSYMIQHLMQKKVEKLWTDDRYRDAFLIDAYVDMVHAVEMSMNHSRYDYVMEEGSRLYEFDNELWMQIENNYQQRQQIENESPQQTVSVCCSLMKLRQFLYVNVPHSSFDYTMADNANILVSFNAQSENVFDGRWLDYDSTMSVMGVLVVILLLNGVCVYWCYYSPHRRPSLERVNSSPSMTELRPPRDRGVPVPPIRIVPSLHRLRSESAGSFDATPASEDSNVNYFRDSFFDTPDVDEVQLLNSSFYKEYNKLYK